LSRWRLAGEGLELETQVTVLDPQGALVARVDFLLDGCVVAEADGVGKYADAADLWAEKRREDRLRELGFGVVRWGWDDMWTAPYDVARRLRAERARGHRIAPGVRLERGPTIRRPG
jgi:hypothetical protein